MPKHDAVPCRRAILGAAILLLLASASVAWCQPAPSQEGLPVELVIDDEPPLSEQLDVMRGLYRAGLEVLPRRGILDGLKSMFVKSDEARYAPVATLVEHLGQIRGELVQTEGLYEAGEERGVLRSMGTEIAVEFMGGTEPQGFEASGGDLDGMAVLITGRVETQSDEPLLRAESVVPSASIAGVRIARILEQQEEYEAAVEAYEDVAGNGALNTRPLTPFARIRAGQLALEQLDDAKRARGQLSAAWQPYSVEQNGQPVYHTWVPLATNGWEKVPAAEAMAPRLDRLNMETLGYRIVDLFVRIAGNSPAMGVLLMAIIVRLAIFPLTKKQLESQRRMQAIQPQIKELQAKHATDKQKFQEEFWALCKENNCNPLGGCLPMLVQMPILIFLYRGIRDYIVQFHGAAFLWVPDLAQPNMVLLILYTLSMVAFQKVAAQSQPTADPQQAQQQKMMAYMMPLMFFFFFQSFPAAFILYWLGSNLIYFGEQLIYVRKAGDEDNSPPPGDRKKPGGGGFVSGMLQAAQRIRKHEPEEAEREPSYEEKRKQAKKGKR